MSSCAHPIGLSISWTTPVHYSAWFTIQGKHPAFGTSARLSSLFFRVLFFGGGLGEITPLLRLPAYGLNSHHPAYVSKYSRTTPYAQRVSTQLSAVRLEPRGNTLKRCTVFVLESQCQNWALTVLYVPSLLDSGRALSTVATVPYMSNSPATVPLYGPVYVVVLAVQGPCFMLQGSRLKAQGSGFGGSDVGFVILGLLWV